MNSDNKQIRDVADVAARIMAGLPPIQEELKGGQTKLDVDKDGDIQADDLADLRAKKKVKKEEVELDEVKMADLPSTKVQGRSYGASKPQPSAFDLVKGPKNKELAAIDAEKKKKKISEMIAIYKEGGLKTFFESIKKEDLIIEEPDSEQFAKDLEDQKKRAAGTKPQADVAKASVQAVKQEAVGVAEGSSNDELNARPGMWRGDAKRMTSKGKPTKDELGMQDNLKNRIKSSNRKGGLTGPKGVLPEEQGVTKESTEQDIYVIDADLANGVDQVDIEERHMTGGEMNKREDIVKSMKKGMAGFKERYGDRAKSVMYATANKQAMKD
jgi:hypothetical protein